MNLSRAWPLIREVGKEYSDDNVPRLSAALAYYTIISLAPMLVLTVMILGLAFGQEAAQGQVEEQVGQVVGPQPASAISDMIHAAGQQGASGWAIALSMLVLLFGASGVFMELQSSMNTIFDVTQRARGGWFSMVRDRLISVSMVFAVAFLLLVSLVISTVLSAVAGKLAGGWTYLGLATDLVVSLIVVTALFAAIFKFLPDVKLQWKDTLVGAVATAVLFTIGKYALSWYLGRGSTASAYGAAGSLAALLIWIYYASQILFIGAEFTQVYANRFGSRAKVETDKAKPAEQRPIEPQGRRPAMAAAPAVAPAPVHGRAGEKIGALTTGAMLGGAAALVGVILKRRIASSEASTDRFHARLDRIENRVGSLARLRAADADDRIHSHLRRIEQRILDDARSAGRVETMPLTARLLALVNRGINGHWHGR